jgi:hypothetical protein
MQQGMYRADGGHPIRPVIFLAHTLQGADQRKHAPRARPPTPPHPPTQPKPPTPTQTPQTLRLAGQTGTGKTHTMTGNYMGSNSGELSAMAGVIPRAIHHIFGYLENRASEYTVKCRCVEMLCCSAQLQYVWDRGQPTHISTSIRHKPPTRTLPRSPPTRTHATQLPGAV